jgi:hypothetical protein
VRKTLLVLAILAGIGAPLAATAAEGPFTPWVKEAKGRCDPATWIPCKEFVRRCGGTCGPKDFKMVCPDCNIRRNNG